VVPPRVSQILVVGPEPPPYTGMEVATQALVRELRAHGIRFVRVNTADPQDLPANRGRLTLHNAAAGARLLLRVTKHLAERRTHAMYIPIAQSGIALYRDLLVVGLAIATRKRVIVHLHGGRFDAAHEERGRVRRAIVNGILSRAAAGIVLSESLRRCLEVVLPADRVHVVANGVDLPGGDATTEGPKGHGCVVLFLGTLYREKGLLAFIEAVAAAQNVQSPITAVIAGRWPDRHVEREARGLVASLGIESRVDFRGELRGSAKRHAFCEADIFCFPSQQVEGQPLVIIEAMAAGLPVVAVDQPGIRDLVTSETGILVDADSAAISAALTELAQDPRRREALGASASAVHRQEFSQQAFGERIVPLIKRYAQPEDSAAAMRTLS
jgi:glycosyltransferase involved in cell wall biosynthesis